MSIDRVSREREHDRHLISVGAEAAWGWTTPAGRMRARRRARLIAEAARLEPGALALEIGCGTGLFTEQFAPSGATLVAIDVSEELIAIARARELPQGQVEFRCGAFETAPLGGPFDAIIGSSVLHHLDMRRALPRIRALLKPGGRLAFAEPNLMNPQVFLERRFRRWFDYVSPDETAFVRWRLRRDLVGAGFSEISIAPFDWLHPRTWPPLISVVSLGGRAAERMPVVREFSGSLLIAARSS